MSDDRGLRPYRARRKQYFGVELCCFLTEGELWFGRDQASDGAYLTKPLMWGKEVMMRKFYGLALALLSVFAVGGYVASAAFAESEILANGNVILASEDLLFELKGELLLEDTGAPGKPDILCTGTFDGLFESGTLAFINEVLDTAGELLIDSSLLNLGGILTTGDDVECVDMSGTCMGVVLVVAFNLPWHLELELLTGDTEEPYMLDFLEEANKEPEYAINCNTLLGLVEDQCDKLVYAFLLDLGSGDVTAGFLPAPEGSCKLGGVGTGVLEGESLIEDGNTLFSLS
jgi:hypothetical protein